jgi:hypothetical protein
MENQHCKFRIPSHFNLAFVHGDQPKLISNVDASGASLCAGARLPQLNGFASA